MQTHTRTDRARVHHLASKTQNRQSRRNASTIGAAKDRIRELTEHIDRLTEENVYKSMQLLSIKETHKQELRLAAERNRQHIVDIENSHRIQ